MCLIACCFWKALAATFTVGAIGDGTHMSFECTALAPLRQQHADLITPVYLALTPCALFFAEQDHRTTSQTVWNSRTCDIIAPVISLVGWPNKIILLLLQRAELR